MAREFALNQLAHRPDGVADQRPALLGVERRIGGEQRVRGPEEVEAAARRGTLAAHRGVGIKLLEIGDRLALQAGLLGDRVALGPGRFEKPPYEVE